MAGSLASIGSWVAGVLVGAGIVDGNIPILIK